MTKQTIENHTFYPNGDNQFIPDVELLSISGDDRDMDVIFLWRGTEQWLAMSKDNQYGDNFWLITKTQYTSEFEQFLDEELGGYDSLENMFSGFDFINTSYKVEFKVVS